METSANLLGLNLRRLREARGWTQAELAEKCELSINMLQKLEYGRTNPSGKTIDTLCKALAVTPAELYQGSISAIPDVSSAIDFLSKFRDLPPMLQRLVLGLVYQDPSYARGIKLNAEAQAELQKLFGSHSKAQ